MALPSLLDEYGDAIEADMQRVYGIDLLDVYRGSLSPRKLLVLIEHLPPGSALWNETGGDSAWTVQEHLIANMLDAINLNNWLTAGDSKAKQPKPVPRPSDLLKKRQQNEALEARLQQFRKGQTPTTK